MIFQWDEKNRAHIGEHGVSPEEAENVVRNAKPPFPEDRGGGKFLIWGTAVTGQYLQVIFVVLPDEEVNIQTMSAADILAYMEGEKVLFVIHAMPMSENQKSQLKTRNKRKGRQ